jgi:hypothetical protein
MIDHDRQVALPLAVADLVDPDPTQAVEQIDLAASLVTDPLENAPDRAPRDAHQRRDRGFRAVARQPRDLILKAASEPTVVPGPRHRGHHHTMPTAVDPWRVGLQEAERRAEVQRAPAAATLASVIAPAAAPAHPAAIPLPPRRADRHDHPSLVARRYVLDHRPLQAEQPGPYPDAAHVASASMRFQP